MWEVGPGLIQPDVLPGLFEDECGVGNLDKSPFDLALDRAGIEPDSRLRIPDRGWYEPQVVPGTGTYSDSSQFCGLCITQFTLSDVTHGRICASKSSSKPGEANCGDGVGRDLGQRRATETKDLGNSRAFIAQRYLENTRAADAILQLKAWATRPYSPTLALDSSQLTSGGNMFLEVASVSSIQVRFQSGLRTSDYEETFEVYGLKPERRWRRPALYPQLTNLQL
ncbi:hypothetical protein B0T13DRAFT_524863 [Neurospora crassa]|nr:hypothetical protein B0T13DRAFT_524863 [Neurospora crassa]